MRMTVAVMVPLLFTQTGCVGVKSDNLLSTTRQCNKISSVSSPFGLKRGFCFVEHSEIGLQVGRTTVMWENDDGTGSAILTWVPEIGGGGGKEEIRWVLDQQHWSALIRKLTDHELQDEIAKNLYKKERFELGSTDGSFYMLTLFDGNTANFFTLHSASKYSLAESIPESVLIDSIQDAWPISLDYPPPGCLKVFFRKYNEKGSVISEAWKTY